MSRKDVAASQAPTEPVGMSTLLRRYGCGPVEFTGGDNALYERHRLFDNVVDPGPAGPLRSHRSLGAILNVASSGKFSSDRTIAEYAADIWKATPCPVE